MDNTVKKSETTNYNVGDKIVICSTALKRPGYHEHIRDLNDEGKPELAAFAAYDYCQATITKITHSETDGNTHLQVEAVILEDNLVFIQESFSHKPTMGGQARWRLQTTEDVDYTKAEDGVVTPCGRFQDFTPVEFALRHWWRDVSFMDWGPALMVAWGQMCVQNWPDLFTLCEQIADPEVLQIPELLDQEETHHYELTGPQYHNQHCVACQLTAHFQADKAFVV